jgi:ABC-2 type transport system ATP-binding protein
MDILTLEHVAMNFGNLSVLKDVSFSVPENSVFGFIGKNGSGKTTTMKIILGFLKPTQGSIYVCGNKVTYGNTKTNQFIGYLPDVPEFYGFMRPKEYLKFCGEISGLHGPMLKGRIDELLGLVGLEGTNRKIAGFSRGMKQRLGIAQALINEPKLLICDEPTSALDPVGRKELLDILKAVKGKTTVVFSTHILSDVERICDRIGLLDDGKIQLEGNLSEIKARYHKHSARIEFFDQESGLLISKKLLGLPFVTQIEHEQQETSILIQMADKSEDDRKVLDLILKENVRVKKFEVVEPSLENVFLEVVNS